MDDDKFKFMSVTLEVRSMNQLNVQSCSKIQRQYIDEDIDGEDVIQTEHVVFLEHRMKEAINFKLKGVNEWTNVQMDVLKKGSIGRENLTRGAAAFGFLKEFEEELDRIK